MPELEVSSIAGVFEDPRSGALVGVNAQLDRCGAYTQARNTL